MGQAEADRQREKAANRVVNENRHGKSLILLKSLKGKWRKWMEMDVCHHWSNNNTMLSPLAHPPFINVRWMCGSPILRWNQLFLLQFSKAVRGPSQHCGRVSCGGGRAMVDASLFILLSTFCWYFVGVFQLNFSVSPVLLAKTQGFGFYFPILC